MAPAKEPRLTIPVLKEKLDLLGVAFAKSAKKADLVKLCEENGLLDPPVVEYKDATKICVIKCSIGRALNLNAANKVHFLGEVEKFVNIVSRMSRRASLVLSYHMTKLVSSGKPIPDFYSTKKFNDTYWKNWLRIGIDGYFPDAKSRLSYEEVKDVIGKVVDPEGQDDLLLKSFPSDFDQVLCYAGHTLRTVVTNNAWVPLFARLARLTKHMIRSKGIVGITAYAVVKAIRSEDPIPEEFCDDIKEYIREVRERLKAKDGERLYDSYGKEEIDFGTMFRFNFWMQKQFESMEQRRIRLMPIFKVGRMHVRLDARTLLSFAKKFIDATDVAMKALSDMDKEDNHKNPKLDMFDDVPTVPTDVKKKNCTPEEWEQHKKLIDDRNKAVEVIRAKQEYIDRKATFDAYTSLQHRVCATLFNDYVNKQRSNKGWKFDNSVSTDGISVSLQYSKVTRVPVVPPKKVKKVKKEGPLELKEYDRNLPTNFKMANRDVVVLGLDPGRSNIATVNYLFVDETTKKSHTRTWKLTRGQYYVESGIQRLNLVKQRRYETLIPRWQELGGPNISLNTSNPSDIKFYMEKYALVMDDWWVLALKRRESWDNLKRYAGKRRVLDSFFSRINKDTKKLFPEKEVIVAYGSAYTSMKATGIGEVAVPVGGAHSACKRHLNTRTQYEFRSTIMDWKTAAKKELVYKKITQDKDQNFHETLHHTSAKCPPFVDQEYEVAVTAYNAKKKHQGKCRRGGSSDLSTDTQEGSDNDSTGDEKKTKRLRYPEVRGLRFSKESSMYHDRDRESALTIARLCCMAMRNLPVPFPFDGRYKMPVS